jgi:hypothetical protein
MRLEPGTYRVDAGRAYRSPKEIWGFREKLPRGKPLDAAREFLAANVETLGIQDALPRLALRALIRGVGATHVILQQRHERIRVHRGFVTVHISKDNEAYLVKSRAAPANQLPRGARFRLTPSKARDAALHHLESRWGQAERTKTSGRVKRWFFHKGELRPAWRVRFSMFGPREEWIVYVDADTGEVLRAWDNLALARGRIFDPSPLVAADYKDLYDTRTDTYYAIPPATFKSRTLRRLSGAGTVLTGKHVSTSLTSPRASAKNSGFNFDYDTENSGFLETMAYYHVDQAVQYVESLGYTGPRRLFKEPVKVNAAWDEGDDDNSVFDPVTKTLHFGVGGVPDAEDAEVILHEFGHALQDAICSDFGQSREASAIGEGFGDYLAASFFADVKPNAYRERVMSWSALRYDVWRRKPPPFLRRVDGKSKVSDFRNRRDEEHFNGQIWSRVLWDIRDALGRKAADAIIIDSHFQLDAYTRLRRAARAIIDADDNLRGGNRQALREIFIRRGFPAKHLQD